MIPGEGRTYYSSDNVCKAIVSTDEEDILYPTEFLNNLHFPGIPNLTSQTIFQNVWPRAVERDEVGEGSNYDATYKDMINLPHDVCFEPYVDPIGSIVNVVYPSLLQKYNDPAYLKEKAILTPKNELVHELNNIIMKMIPGEGRTYYSLDNVCKASVNTDEEDILYPTEFLNNLRFPGIPNLKYT
ncbi:hypothetical protein H5410_040276 [Solanum commersonii]|uniref:ATP-dependent DNA helicase n=1 Tax=Solanum commersonii TaxID=4109 RepID=A0A9J5XPN4_SOLCO|nr:hypothetical protein H5410_040276 [Solanum commersonii]